MRKLWFVSAPLLDQLSVFRHHRQSTATGPGMPGIIAGTVTGMYGFQGPMSSHLAHVHVGLKAAGFIEAAAGCGLTVAGDRSLSALNLGEPSRRFAKVSSTNDR